LTVKQHSHSQEMEVNT